MTGKAAVAIADFISVTILEDVEFCIINPSLNTKNRTFNKNLIFCFILAEYRHNTCPKWQLAATRM